MSATKVKGALLQMLFERDSAREQANVYKRLAEEGASFRCRYEASQDALTEALAAVVELKDTQDALREALEWYVAECDEGRPAQTGCVVFGDHGQHRNHAPECLRARAALAVARGEKP